MLLMGTPQVLHVNISLPLMVSSTEPIRIMAVEKHKGKIKGERHNWVAEQELWYPASSKSQDVSSSAASIL